MTEQQTEPERAGAASSGGGDDGGSVRAPRTGVRGWSPRRLAGTIGAIIAAAAGAVPLIQFIDGLVNPPPPARIQTDILSARYEGPETLAEWRKDIGQPLTGFAEDELQEEGLLFTVVLRLTGSVGERFLLRSSVYSNRSGRRLRGELYNQIAADITPRSLKGDREILAWIPYPPRRGTYHVRFTLLDRRGVYADGRRTKPFEVRSIPEVG